MGALVPQEVGGTEEILPTLLASEVVLTGVQASAVLQNIPQVQGSLATDRPATPALGPGDEPVVGKVRRRHEGLLHCPLAKGHSPVCVGAGVVLHLQRLGKALTTFATLHGLEKG